MFFNKICSYPVICTLQFLHRNDKNKCFKQMFSPHFYFCIISKCFIATFLEECSIFLAVLASFFTWWQYGGEQPPRRRWRKTLGCHRDADNSAPSVKVKTDRGSLNNIVSAAKKKKKNRRKRKMCPLGDTNTISEGLGRELLNTDASRSRRSSEIRTPGKIFLESEDVIGRRWRAVGPTCTSNPTSVFFHAGKKCD